MDFVRSFLFVTVGSVLWVVGSLIVAFPGHAMELNLVGMLHEFISVQRHPISVLVLWVLDLVIALGCLQDARMRLGMAKWLGTLMLAVLGYLAVAIFLPTSVPAFTQQHQSTMALLALACILVARGLSYAGPEQAVTVKKAAH